MNEYWYLDSQNQQHGPIPPHQFSSVGVTPQTLVWCTGMDAWKPAGELPELAGYFSIGSAPRQQTPPINNYQQPNGCQQTSSCPNGTYCNPPSSNMVWAILTTILCCLPFGIVSIIYASKVDSEYARGNYDNAIKNSKLAKNWAIAAAATGLGIGIVYIIIQVVFLGAAFGAFAYC